jgi:hypothetical protein
MTRGASGAVVVLGLRRLGRRVGDGQVRRRGLGLPAHGLHHRVVDGGARLPDEDGGPRAGAGVGVGVDGVDGVDAEAVLGTPLAREGGSAAPRRADPQILHRRRAARGVLVLLGLRRRSMGGSSRAGRQPGRRRRRAVGGEGAASRR